MQIFNNPERKEWDLIVRRPRTPDAGELESSVTGVLREVELQGDKALRKYTLQYDKVSMNDLLVEPEAFLVAQQTLDATLKAAILSAKVNIEAFHKPQLKEDEVVETMPGVFCWRKNIPIEKIGIYIPGGSAPLFSTVLMLGVPAKLAGCKEIILCSPPDATGKLHPAILFAAKVVGITKVFRAGGAQAIGAMAYGTESIPKVDKIFGPGNRYVTMAKQLVQLQGIAIDIPAGPSEVAVYADETANASFVAADLLSQAEHGPDSQVLLVSCVESVIKKVQEEVKRQLELLPRKGIAEQALVQSKLVIVKDEQEAIDLLNLYAGEHVILSCDKADAVAEKVVNAGSVFLGHYSPESAGDYASGTNHTLPTNGFAKGYSGVSADSFVKKVTFQKLSPEGLKNISKTVITMAEAEGLEAHAAAVRVRLKEIEKQLSL